MAVKQRLGQEQRLTLTPAMRQSLGLLRMPAHELAEAMAAAAAENPFLIFVRPAPASGGSAYDLAMATVAAREGPRATLERQLIALGLPQDRLALARYLAGELREDGYLDASVAEIADEIGVAEAEVEAALTALQSCEPAGVGARTLGECLELQLVDRGLDRPLAHAVVGRIEDFARGRLVLLSRRLKLPEHEIRRISGLVRGLVPRPFDALEEPEPATLVADLVVTRNPDGTPHVALSDRAPVLRLDHSLSAGADAFATDRRAEANALVRALRRRQETLLAIGVALVARQSAFFTLDPGRLEPLSRAELAADLNLHPSTLGRAVSGKGIEAWGIVQRLSDFFSPAIAAAQGPPVAAQSVRRTIARMVAAEDPGAPLSDEEIRLRLAEDGVDISRRTVAKYRGGMKIPPSSQRRRLAPRRSGQGAAGGGNRSGGAAGRGQSPVRET